MAAHSIATLIAGTVLIADTAVHAYLVDAHAACVTVDVIEAKWAFVTVAINAAYSGTKAVEVVTTGWFTFPVETDPVADAVVVGVAASNLDALPRGLVADRGAPTGLAWAPRGAGAVDTCTARVAIGHPITALTLDAHTRRHVTASSPTAVFIA